MKHCSAGKILSGPADLYGSKLFIAMRILLNSSLSSAHLTSVFRICTGINFSVVKAFLNSDAPLQSSISLQKDSPLPSLPFYQRLLYLDHFHFILAKYYSLLTMLNVYV